MVRLEVLSVGIVQDSTDVVLILRAPHTGQLLVMAIGPFEGRAIAMGMEGAQAPRPLTHDLLAETIRALGASVQKVVIRDFQDGAFLATLYLEDRDGRVIELDSRPSDAVALAVRSGAPVFCDPMVMALHGVNPDEVGGQGEASEETGGEDEPFIH
ncbi:MAG: bifunctional nuclease family protein [Firmicutes bacterium]|nr:bifunctional nuclease family protein [Bacillota bacterium]